MPKIYFSLIHRLYLLEFSKNSLDKTRNFPAQLQHKIFTASPRRRLDYFTNYHNKTAQI